MFTGHPAEVVTGFGGVNAVPMLTQCVCVLDQTVRSEGKIVKTDVHL